MRPRVDAAGIYGRPSVAYTDAGGWEMFEAVAMELIHCEVCGQVIGAYEPALAIRGDRTVLIRAREKLRCELQTSGTTAVHKQCNPVREPVRHSG